METLVLQTLPTLSCRQKILKEKAVPMIEGYMFEEHEMIRRAATECMCNLAMSKEVRVGPGGPRDRDAKGPVLLLGFGPRWHGLCLHLVTGAGSLRSPGQRPVEAAGAVQWRG